MNAYLEIAEKVLRYSKAPMSAKAILKAAYLSNIAPTHIYGKTQHKTLQARLSEDILRNKEKSLFCRTKPGYFCLREFFDESSVYHARRRARDLLRGSVLLVNFESIERFEKSDKFIHANFLRDIVKYNLYKYKESQNFFSDEIMVLVGVSLLRGRELLSYRVGRYRDDRDAFANKKSLLFLSVLTNEDNSFFTENDLGLREKASFAIAADLDISVSELYSPKWKTQRSLKFFIKTPDKFHGKNVIIAFMEFIAPASFMPLAKKLSLNELSWLDLDKLPNNLGDFDPYSRAVLSYYTAAGSNFA